MINISNKKHSIHDEIISQCPISQELLEKDSLLTPRLNLNFGKINVIESDILECIETDNTYLRESVLYQKSTGNKILEATLRITKNKLPNKFIQDLRLTSTPFGVLLKKYKIPVEIKNRQIIVNIDSKKDVLRIGRSHIITKLDSDEIISHVRELLVSEEELYLSKKNTIKIEEKY